MDEFARFVFEKINDLFVIIDKNCQIIHVSHSLVHLAGISTTSFENLFSNSNDLSIAISDSLQSSTPKENLLFTTRNTKIELFTSIYPFKKEKLLLLFRKNNSCVEERRKWLEIAELQCGMRGGIVEWDQAKNDCYQKFLHSSSERVMRRLTDRSSLTGYWFQDFKAKKERAEKYLTAFREVNGTSKITEIKEVVSDDKNDVLLMNCRYLGCSENGNPLFYYYGIENDAISDLHKELALSNVQLSKQINMSRILKAFVNNSPDWMTLVETIDNDNNLIYRFANESYCKAFNKSLHELLDQPARNIIGDERANNWIDQLKQCKQDGKPVHFEFVSFGHYYSAAIVQLDQNSFSCMFKDINNKKLYEIELESTVQKRTAQLEQALVVKSRFLANMSHELRTPLAGTMGCLNLLTDSNLSSECKDIARTAQICGEQLMGVINDILEVSKLEENKVQLEELPFSLPKVSNLRIKNDICQLIQDSMEVICFECEKKGLELVSDIDLQIQDTVIGDARRVCKYLFFVQIYI